MSNATFRPTPQELTTEAKAVKTQVKGGMLFQVFDFIARVADPHTAQFVDDLQEESLTDQERLEKTKLHKKLAVLDSLTSVQPCRGADPRPGKAHGGKCTCGEEHALPRSQAAVNAVTALHATLANQADQSSGAWRDGKMLGTMLCTDESGKAVTLQAHSGPPTTLVTGMQSCRQANAPGLMNLTDPSRDRAFTPEDEVDNPPGNCAAQKLFYYVAEYNRNEPGRRLAAKDDEITAAQADVRQHYDDIRDLNFDRTCKALPRMVSADDLEKQGITKERLRNLTTPGDNDGRNAGHLRSIIFAGKKFQDELATLEAVVARLQQEKAAIQKKPPHLSPQGIAEAWIGADKGGFPNKRNGEIIDSCYTCHALLGEVLHGV